MSWSAGIISGVRPLKTRKGDRMGVFTLEDRQGGIEVVVYTEPFARFERLIENGGAGRGARPPRQG